MKSMKQWQLKALVKAAYILQRNRIRIGNSLVANFKRKLGKAPEIGTKDDSIGKEGKEILVLLRLAHDRLMDGLENVPAKSEYEKRLSRLEPLEWEGKPIYTDYSETCLTHCYLSLKQEEEDHFARFPHLVNDFPIWTEWLKDVAGCGPTMAAIIITSFDISAAKYAQSLCKYAGLDVVPTQREDGTVHMEGRGTKKSHQRDEEYKDKDGKTQTKRVLSYNPWLKTKLLGVLGASFLRLNLKTTSPYRDSYYEYKHRLEQDDRHKKKTPLHRHRMAVRRMVKLFLCDLYEHWRPLENLPVHDPYHVAKLGMPPHGTVTPKIGDTE